MYSEDKCDDKSLCLDEVFQDNLDTHTALKETVELYSEDVCEDDKPLFLDILLRMHAIIAVKNMLKNIASRVLFERRKLDLSIFIFNEPTNDQSFENITQKPQIDKSLKNPSEYELNCLDESIGDDLVSYPPKDMINSRLEEMYEEKLKF